MRTIHRDNYTPHMGDYRERIVIDDVQGNKWIFDCDGVFTDFTTPTSGGFEFVIVEELPEVGDPGKIYLVLKEETPEGDIYDEWIWVPQGDVYGWEHLGTTNEVTITVDDSLSDTSENPVQNKVITNALGNKLGTENVLTDNQYEALWS